MSSNRIEFVEPASLTEGEAQRRQLAEEISDIAQQLNGRKAAKQETFVERHPNGIQGAWELTPEERKENVDYHNWRKKALGALRARERVLRQLNDWLKAERRRLHMNENGDGATTQLLSDAYQLFEKLRADDVEFDPEEWAFVEKLREFVDTHSKPNAA